MAILFLQLLQERIADYNIKVIGTDIDPDCIAKAKTGLYEPSHLKEVNKNILNKYFHREGENFRVKDEVKHLTEFKIHDLTHCQPQADPPVAENFEDATREAQRNKIVIPAGLLRHSKALGYEGWKAGIQSQNKYLDSHFHGNDRKRDKQLKNVDLILCRNVVIYFTKPLQELVYGLFLKSLNQGGFLVLGKVESLGGYAQGFFEALDNKERIYRKM